MNILIILFSHCQSRVPGGCSIEHPNNTLTATVGSLVAAQLNIPNLGLVWCRVRITSIVPGQQSKGGKKGGAIPASRFMVESIDHFPAVSEKPVPVCHLRPLCPHARAVPFCDRLYHLLNTMPANKQCQLNLYSVVRDDARVIYEVI